MIAFIVSVYSGRGLDGIFAVVEVVYKKDRETFDLYLRRD